MANDAYDKEAPDSGLIETVEATEPDSKRPKLDNIDASTSTQVHIKTENQDELDNGKPLPQTNNDDEGSAIPVQAGDMVGNDTEDDPPKNESEFPELPIYHPSFKKAEGLAKKPIDLLIHTIEKSDHKPKEINELLKNIQGSRTFEYPEPKMIGLLGHSGVGKSSLINSILDSDEFAYKAGGQDSGTFVPHEYHKPHLQQSSPFTTCVQFCTDGEQEERLRSFLSSYYRYRVSHPDSLDGDEDSEAETALENLIALFCDHEEFRDEEAADVWLKSARSHDDNEKLKALRTWARQLFNNLHIHDNVLRLEAGDMSELNDKLQRYARKVNTDDESDPVPSLWPFVNTIQIHTKTRVLEHGIIVSDLPGVTDTNRIRVRSTQSYINRCDRVILVAPISRIARNDWVSSNLLKFSRRGINKCILVLTKSDVLKDPEELEDLSRSQKEQFQSAKKMIKEKEAQTKELERMKKGACGDEFRKLDEELGNARLEKEHISTKLMQDGINIQNAKAVETMRKKYRKITGDNNFSLPVFCVSNEAYRLHCHGFAESGTPYLNLEDTKIPELKRFLYSLPAMSQLKTFQTHVRNAIPNCISGLELWCNLPPVERRKDIENIINGALPGLKDVVSGLHASIRAYCDDEILANMKTYEHDWTLKATEKTRKWGQYNATNFLAYCRKKGIWKVKKSGGPRQNEDWNQELLEPVDRDMMPYFHKNFEVFLRKLKNEKSAEIEEVFKKVQNSLKMELTTLLVANDALHSQLGQKKYAMIRAMTTSLGPLKKTIHGVGDAVCLANKESYICEIMSPVYAQCVALTGKDSHAKRRHTLSKTVGESDRIFSALHDGAQKDLEDALSEWHLDFGDKVEQKFEQSLKVLRKIFESQDLESPEDKILREKLKDAVAEAKRILQEGVEPLLQECESYGKKERWNSGMKRDYTGMPRTAA